MQPFLSPKAWILPQNLSAWTAQVGAGATEMDVEGTEVVVVGFVVVEAGLLVEEEEEEEEDCLVDPLSGVLYQFATGSLRHSPAVTPFQPFALMKS